jgi:hypothetical protein
MIFQCSDPPPNVSVQNDGAAYIANVNDAARAYGWTSDEVFVPASDSYKSTNAICIEGDALVGMYSTGSYSDNIRAICAHVTHYTSWYSHAPAANEGISEEGSPHFSPPANSYLSGASCTGSYCDNMFYRWTHVY